MAEEQNYTKRLWVSDLRLRLGRPSALPATLKPQFLTTS